MTFWPSAIVSPPTSTSRVAGQVLHRCGQPQQLVHRRAHRGRVVEQHGPLVGSLVQQFEGPAQQTGGRVVAAGDHGEHEPDDPLLVDRPLRSEPRHQVLARLGPQPGDELARVGDELGQRLGRRHEVAGRVRGDDGVGPGVEATPVGARDPEVVGHEEAGQRLEEDLDDVDLAAPGVTDAVQAGIDELDDPGLEGRHPARSHGLGHETPHRSVVGWVHHHDRGGTVLEQVHDVGIQGEAPRRGEGGGVAHRVEHVLEARQHDELAVVGIDGPVHRVVVAQPPVVVPGIPPGVPTAEAIGPGAYVGRAHGAAPRKSRWTVWWALRARAAGDSSPSGRAGADA
jgi:hypothetical protein